MRKHIELYRGVTPMFIRCTVNSEVLAEFAEYFENATFGIFETGSAFVPFSTKTEEEEQWILRYCKPGKTWQTPMRGGKTWRTISFDLPAPAFQAGTDGADMRIQTTDHPVCLHLVKIERR